jgi:hypothetical protein
MIEQQHPELRPAGPTNDKPTVAANGASGDGDRSASATVLTSMSTILKDFDYKSLVPGALVGLVSYLAMVVLAVVTLVLALVGVSASNGGSAEIPSSSMFPSGTAPSLWSVVVQLAVQLVVMSQLGVLGTSVDATIPLLGNVHGSANLFAVPLLLTALSVVILFLGGRIAARRTTAEVGDGLWRGSLAAGLVFSLLVNVGGGIFSIALPPSVVKISPVCAVTFGSVVTAVVLGMFATLAGRLSMRRRAQAKTGVRAGARAAIEAVAVHYGIFLGVAIPFAVVAMGIKLGWQATLSAPLWAPTAGLFLLGLGHLSALNRTWSVGSSMSSSANSSGSDIGFGFGSGLTQFGVPGWIGWLLLLLALIAMVATSVFWYLRRGPLAAKKASDWAVLPAAFLIAGALSTWISTASAAFEAGSFASGAGTVSLAGWTAFALMVWGAATEASARYLAPHLSRYIPMRLVHRVVHNQEENPTPAASADAQDPSSATRPVGKSAGEPVFAAHPALLPREPMGAGRRRALALVFGGIGLVVLLIVGGAITINVLKAGNGPAKPVEAYLQALKNGDATTAMALSDPGLANDQRVLLTDQVYSKANKRVDSFEIVSSKVSDDTAVVVAELHQDGRKTQTSFSLRKANPELLDDHWKMESAPIGSVSVSTNSPVNTVLVNGQEINIGSRSAGLNLPALPGEYVVELPSSQKYLTAAKSTVLVPLDLQTTPTLSLEVEASEALKAEAMAQVDAHLAECLKSTEGQPTDCPFSMYSSSSHARNFHWSMPSKPSFSLTRDPYSGSDFALRLSTVTSGKATVSYEEDNSYGFGSPEWKPATDTMSFSLDATVTLENGEVKIVYSRY